MNRRQQRYFLSTTMSWRWNDKVLAGVSLALLRTDCALHTSKAYSRFFMPAIDFQCKSYADSLHRGTWSQADSPSSAHLDHLNLAFDLHACT